LIRFENGASVKLEQALDFFAANASGVVGRMIGCQTPSSIVLRPYMLAPTSGTTSSFQTSFSSVTGFMRLP
jgi:hypothetical protein